MVIESLALESNCNLTNAMRGEIAVDVAVRNLNQIHHPVSTEVMVNELVLFCPKYRLQVDEMVQFASPGSERVFKNKNPLLATELLNFRCGLQLREEDVSKGSESEFISSQLSRVVVHEESQGQPGLMSVEGTNSFLMKEETKFLRVFGQTSNNEEFNQIVATPDQHMTLILNWSAKLKDNNAVVQRTVHGQHFVQMRHLYESSFCPRGSEQSATTKSFTPDENTFSIYDFGALTQSGGAGGGGVGSNDWAVQNM